MPFVKVNVKQEIKEMCKKDKWFTFWYRIYDIKYFFIKKYYKIKNKIFKNKLP